MEGPTPDAIRAAHEAMAGEIVRTPTVAAPRLTALTGAHLHVKLESLQFTGSFKDRGALHKLSGLDAGARGRGVAAASAGNHAQAVAHRARRLGIPATIVMPETTPFTKVERTASFGARVELHGESLLEAGERAEALARDRGLTPIHPYDDPGVITGQGTVALEILADLPDVEVLVVPIGGGGLIGGMGIAAKALRPELTLVGVQTARCPAMHAALAGSDPPLRADTIADGIAVKRPGRLTRPLVERHVDEILLVEEDVLERAVQLYAHLQNLVVEGAGAASLAAVLSAPEHFAGRTTCLVVGGGNIDARLLSTVLMRGLRAAGRLVRLRIEIDDRPGVLARVAGHIGAAGANIVDIHHQRLFSELPVRQAMLDVVVETQDPRHIESLLATLAAEGFPATTG